MKSARDAGCPKIAIGITGLRENLARYDGIEVPYRRPSFTCCSIIISQMDIYIHMRGGDIGTINIYQAPVEGFAVKKFSLSNHQGSNWFKRQIQFDSDKEFQVCIMTSLRTADAFPVVASPPLLT